MSRFFLVAAMAACLVPLFAIALARRILALQLPGRGIAAEAAVVPRYRRHGFGPKAASVSPG